MRTRSFIVLLLACAVTSPALQASTQEAQSYLRNAVEEVLKIADRVSSRSSLATTVRPVLERHVSFETMTRRAVGPGWRQFTADQQRKATQLFSTLVIRTYSNKFTPGERPVIDYKNAVSPASGRVDVPTTLVYQGSRYSVTYRLEQEGRWRITDVVIEGVSMIANYRTQLDAMFKKGGAPAVISSLEQSVARPS